MVLSLHIKSVYEYFLSVKAHADVLDMHHIISWTNSPHSCLEGLSGSPSYFTDRYMYSVNAVISAIKPLSMTLLKEAPLMSSLYFASRLNGKADVNVGTVTN
jgi:hypothetical protein